VVNVITAKPTDVFEGNARLEYGNYNAIRAKGAVNLPISDLVALRLAGSYLKRDGFGENLVTRNDIDDRDLYAFRATLGFNTGGEGARAYLLYEHFNEDDNRARVGKQICQKDPGPASVGGVPVLNPLTRGLLSQGCTPQRIDSPLSLGTLNSIPTLGGAIGAVAGLIPGDAYAGKVQDPDLRNIESAFDPTYQASADVIQLNVEIDITDSLTLTALTSYNKDEINTFADYNRTTPVVGFNPIPGLAPGGVFTDPQLGASNLFRTFDISAGESESWSQEFRLSSDFDGPFNFNVGGIFLDYDTPGADYFVFSNTLTAAALIGPPLTPPGVGIDPSPISGLIGDGHNYFRSTTPYQLTSRAAFGEFYYEPLDNLKFTLGLRYTDDDKKQRNLPVGLLTPGFGYNPALTTVSEARFKETTGRLGVDWQPDLGFTNDTLVYAAYARGYKGGGINPPQSVGLAGVSSSFAPEFIDAFEIGTKNTLLDGRLLLNLTGFFYDYQGYQISRIISRTAVNDNIDAEIRGLEVESIFEPVRNLRFNMNLGFLSTEIKEASLVDIFDKRQGDAAFTYISGPLVGGGCLAPTAQVANFVAVTNTPAGAAAAALLLQACAGTLRTGSTAPSATNPSGTNPLAPFGVFLDTREGFLVDVSGNELPNSPNFTASFGVEYTFELGGAWTLVPRLDYSYQGESYTRIYNREFDELPSFDNVNVNVRLVNDDLGLTMEGYVRNATDEEAITDAYLTDDSSGLFRNIFLTEPRTYGVAVSKRF
jgi:outer membrane receptor protein involved in Fe transport